MITRILPAQNVRQRAQSSASRYTEEPAGLLQLDPQLICYSWMSGISDVALVVFVRKQMPEIQYLKTSISEDQRREFGRLVEMTIAQVEAGQFPSHSGIRFPRNGCVSCAHLGLCLDDSKLIEANLVRQAKASDFDVPQFTPPLRDVARSLGASVPREPELQAGIVPLLEDQNDRLESELPTDLRAVVVEAMLELCHRTAKHSIYVSDVADAANKILEQHGEPLVMTDKAVGTKMGSLGFAASRLDSAGRGIQLMKAVRQRIHNVACDWNILAGKNLDLGGCEHCQNFLSRTCL